MESPLSFNSSENFRKKLLVRNLPPYKVDGSFSSGDKPAIGEFRLLDYAIVDSTSVEVIGDKQERILNPINQYGPEGQNSYGDTVLININRNFKTNEGEYGFTDSINSDLELIGDKSEITHIIRNPYKPQTNNKGYGDSVYYINNDKVIQTVGSGEYTISDTIGSFLESIGNNQETNLKVKNVYKNGGTDYGTTKYSINDDLNVLTNGSGLYEISDTIGSQLESIGNYQETVLKIKNVYKNPGTEFGTTRYSINNDLIVFTNGSGLYEISDTFGSQLEVKGNQIESVLITKNKYTPENSSDYGSTRYNINNDLILGTNEGEYNYADTILSGLETKGVSIRPTLFVINGYQPENGQSTSEVSPFINIPSPQQSNGNYDYGDTIGSELENRGVSERPSLITTNQYGPDNITNSEVDINQNLQTNSNEGEYGFPDTVDSPLEQLGEQKYTELVLNTYSPETLVPVTITPNNNVPIKPNQGVYDINDTFNNELVSVGAFKETEAYVKNKYVTGDGEYEVLTIDDLQFKTTGLPYANSDSTFVFVPSTYSPATILLSDNPSGSEGSLSQDSQLAAIGAKQLQKEFKHRVALELLQQTLGRVNIFDSDINPDTGEISVKPNLDPFNAIGLLTGNIPIIARNYSITDPDSFLGQGINFAAKLAGTYSPYSYIPNEYFDYPDSKGNGPFKNILSTIGGALGKLFSIRQPKNQSSSELFLEYTTVATRSLLYTQLRYNPYRPNYKIGNNLLAPKGVFYIGDRKNHITELVSPFDELPLSKDGDSSSNGPVLSYGNVGKLYEGEKLTGTLIGLNTRNLYSAGLKEKNVWIDGNIVGGFTWVSNKGRGSENYTLPGKLQGRGGEDFEDKSEFTFDRLSAYYSSSQSTTYDLTPGSILDTTQKLVDAGNMAAGTHKLEHVGNAINQVSKVFNDGYQELTKGSRVVRYTTTNSVGGGNVAGFEYCRVFTKDRPYYTFDELQKTDGNIRKYTNSVLDNTFNLNIAPMSGVDNISSTNIRDGKVKKYMFSLENLSWRTSNRPGFTYDDLPGCEKGPNGGRIMWFPPYDLTFDETISTGWQDNTFLGRPEPVYTYSNTSRKGNISFKIIVDHPSILNVLVDKELNDVASRGEITQIIDSFFAGCTKYDLYDLVKKFPMFTPSDIFETQLITTPEDLDNYSKDLPSEIIEKEVVTTNVPPSSGETTPTPCTSWDYNIGAGPSDLTYTGCDGTQIVISAMGTGSKGSVCVKNNTTPVLSNPVTDNTVVNTNSPCTSGTTTVTTTVPEPPVSDQFPEIGFFFHNDFPDPKTRLTDATKPFDEWLTIYKGLENKYLTTGGNSVPATTSNFGGALNKIIKYDDTTYTDYTNTVLNDSTNTEMNEYLANYIDTRTSSVSEFFNFIDNEFEEAKKFITVIGPLLDAGNTISFDLLGSASSVTNNDYNNDLSKRRISSVVKWFNKQTTPNGTKLEKYVQSGKLKIKEVPQGETGSLIEKGYTNISCTKSFKNNKNEGTVSINAMACRRVKLTNVKNDKAEGTDGGTDTGGETTTNIVTSTVVNNDIDGQTTSQTPGGQTTPITTNPFVEQTPTTSGSTNITPQSEVTKNDPTKKTSPTARKDLTKRLARKLLTECNYFEMVRQENPMIYDGIKSKIQHFHPTFHSITPEGLNARLTFLQQCMRPGDTIPTVSKNDNGTENLLYNDVTNSVFGAPPICVLRIGDFFHTKIVIDSLSIKYEDGRFDLNPEGIGVQPMIADVTLSFNFIGGHGLAGPIAQLQNALSFNYYANTEMYDERAESTEDVTSQYDAEILADAKNTLGIVDTNANRPIENDGGVPIGVVQTSSIDVTTSAVTGTITYKEIMKKLSDSTKTCLKTTFDVLEKTNSDLLIGGIQMLTKDRKYTEGYFNYLGGNMNNSVNMFGMSNSLQQKVEDLINKAKEDVDNDVCPILNGIENENLSDSQIRKVKKQIKLLIDGRSGVLLSSLESAASQINVEELKLIKIIDQVNYVSNANDGYIAKRGNVVVYDIVGTTKVTPPNASGVADTLSELVQDSLLIKDSLNTFYDRIYSNNLIPTGDTEYNDTFTFSSYFGDANVDGVPNDNRFFMLFGNEILADPVKFASSVVSVVQNTTDAIEWNKFILTNLGWGISANINTGQFSSGPIGTGLYSQYKKSKTTVDTFFKNFKDNYFTNTFNTFNPYNINKERVMNYKTQIPIVPPSDVNLKDIYSSVNSIWDKFNLKKTFT
jgi:hypothetical protein